MTAGYKVLARKKLAERTQSCQIDRNNQPDCVEMGRELAERIQSCQIGRISCIVSNGPRARKEESQD